MSQGLQNKEGQSMRFNYTPRLGVFIFLLGIVILGVIFMPKALYTMNYSNRPFHLGLSEPVDKLEPAMLANHGQRLVASAIYEGLVYYDEASQNLQPRLSKSWKYSPDGKSLTIYLRHDVKFSNGKKLSAQDVKASWEYNISTSSDWNNTCLFLPISGSKERLNGKSLEVTGIQVLDQHSLKIMLYQPNAAFLCSLSNPVFWVMDMSSGLTPPAGTGPYLLKEKSPTSLLLLGNDYYYRGQPHLSALNVTVYPDAAAAYKGYQEGKLDFLDTLPMSELASIRQNPQYKGLLLEKAVLDIYCLGFNMNRDPYANSYLLRRALNYAIDRDHIIKQLLSNSYLSAKGLIPAGLEAYNPSIYGYRYNADKARQLLAEAGYPAGKGLPILTLTYNDDPGHALVAGEIARQLAVFGIRVQIQAQGWDYYKKQVNNHAISFFRLGWAADYPDADNFLYSLFHSSQDGNSNLCGYHNPQVDRILDASRAQYKDPQARLKLLRRAEEMIIDDAPCLWLFQKKAEKLVSRDVRHLNLDQMEMFDWYPVGLARPTEKVDKQTD
jgi:oligopeptide transport system substrate-binding protein